MSNRWTNADGHDRFDGLEDSSSYAFALPDYTHVTALKSAEPVDAAGKYGKRRSDPPPVPSRCQ